MWYSRISFGVFLGESIVLLQWFVAEAAWCHPFRPSSVPIKSSSSSSSGWSTDSPAMSARGILGGGASGRDNLSGHRDRASEVPPSR